ncbi:hypothetical protein PSHT_00108 [Puccinia striiformis]|uniref:Arginosuccinase n=1 Tax=Puccinia striiformis TaxID=27350 RepID=A0A2S4WNT2_9BASI|nr:hypothetical protein PSHT_00108 [Puccinia striiformis]
MAEQVSKQKLWGGRFTGTTDPLMHQFNQSLSYDKRMFKADIKGSQAYARISAIRTGLEEVLNEWQTGAFVPHESDEDIHTANERRLMEKIGKVAGKLHTGRSRNDQVATDMRLWLMEETDKLLGFMESLIKVIAGRAEKEIAVLMPGYTHLQPNPFDGLTSSCHMPRFPSDYNRLKSLFPRIATLPLGSGPLAGNPFQRRSSIIIGSAWLSIAVDQLHARESALLDLNAFQLGLTSFSIPQGVADRDFVAEFLFWCTMTMVHVSRLAEDLIIYSSAEFGYVTLSDAYRTFILQYGIQHHATKEKPRFIGLLRGKSGRTFGQLSGFLMTYKGLPATYNKDLQEDKEPMFDAADTLSASIQILEGVMATLEIDAGRMQAALTPDMLATDLAEYLVRKNKLIMYQAQHERKDVKGGTSKRAVLEQIEIVLNQLKSS